MHKALPLLLSFIAGSFINAEAVLPAGSDVRPADGLVDQGGAVVAKGPVKISVPVSENCSSVIIHCTAGSSGLGLNAELVWDDGSDKVRLPFRVNGEANAPDQFIGLAKGKRFFVRPNLSFYATAARRQALIDGWSHLPPASAHPIKIEIRSWEDRAELWLNDRIFDEFKGHSGFLNAIEFSLHEGASIREIIFSNKTSSSRFLPLTVASFSRPDKWDYVMGTMGVIDEMKDAKLSLSPGLKSLDGIPFNIAPSGKSVNISHMGYLACPIDDLVSSFWRRSSLDALPEACIISVPLDTYAAAYILCAATKDDESKMPEFTLRLSRNANGRGDALSDTRVKLPRDGKETEDAKRVGMVEYNGKKVPLWQVRVPLKSGLIQDVIRENEAEYGYSVPLATARYLDIELMEPVDGSEEEVPFPTELDAASRRSFLPKGLRTSVHVFGLTLEKSPVELVVRSNVPGFAFYEAEKPALKAELNIREAGKYLLEWNFADVDGKIAASGSREINASGANQDTVEIPLQQGAGWYASQVKVRDSGGRDLVDHRGTFVLLPPDTRQAGRESPYGTWWFNWAHGGTKDYVNVGRMFERAGLRHTMLSSDTVMANNKVTTWAIPWKQPSLENWVGGLEEHIRKHLEQTPEVTTVMIHHESDSYDGRFPSELWGEDPKPRSEKSQSAWELRMKYLLPGLQMIREKFPQLKMQFGNTGDSCALVAELFRMGVPKEYVDFIAVEDLGQTIIPERPVTGSLQSAWYLRETARHFGYTNAKITGCYEWIGRMHTKLGLKLQAEYYVRDMLHARAYGFHTIAPGSIHDAGQGYFHSIWGNGAFCYRYPYMYPKPSYAAVATHTRVLDSTKFMRMTPTGSHSLYALEFERNGEWIYAIWTPRGERETKMAFPADAEVLVTDLYGREQKMSGKEITVTAATGAKYVTSKAQVVSVTAGKASFPDDPVPPQNATIADAMDSVSNWRFEPGSERKGMNLPHRRAGNFDTRVVKDEQMGYCIELELKPEGTLPWPALQEQIWLRANDQQPYSGSYKHVGVWVKGNSSWGEVNIEVTGYAGKKQVLYPNLQGSGYINFDGWNFLRFNLPEGPEWQTDVAISAIFIANARQVLYGTEFAPVENLKLRLKNATLF
jgi:hypothetical protein